MKKLAILLVFMAILFGSSSSQASHLYGLDMSWESLGNDSFLITVQLYRDCNGDNMGSLDLGIRSSCGFRSQTVPRTRSGINVTPLCNSVCNSCENASCAYKYGIELYEFQVIVNLSKERQKNCCWVDFEFQDCCLSRSYTVVSSSDLFQSMAINICLADGLKSPALSSPPVLMSSLAKDFFTDLGSYRPSDSSGIKVVNSLTPLMQTRNTPITYSGSYTYNSPLYYLSFPKYDNSFPRGFNLDSTTGHIKYRPMKEMVAAYGIKMEQFKNGALVGVTRRFITHTIIKAPSTQPHFRNRSTLIHNKYRSKDLIYNVELGTTWHEIIAEELELADTSMFFDIKLKGLPNAYQKLSKSTKTSYGATKSLDVNWFVDSTRYKIGDTIRATITVNAETCPLIQTYSKPIILIIKDKNTNKSPITITELDTVCGKYQLIVPKLYSTGTIQWIINGTVKARKYYNDTNFIYHPLTPDTQFIEVKYITPTGFTSIYDTLIPRKGAKFHLKNLPSKIYCVGDELLHTLEFEDKNTNPTSVYWEYLADSGNDLKVKFNVDYKDTFSLKLKDSTSGCNFRAAIPIHLKNKVYTNSFYDTIKVCSNDSFSLRLPMKGKKNERWLGPTVVKRRFYRDTLKDGIHRIKYNFESNHYCVERDQAIIFTDVPELKLDTSINLCNDKNPVRLVSNYSKTVWSGEWVAGDIFRYYFDDTTVILTATIKTIAGCRDQKNVKLHIGARTTSTLKSNDTTVCYFSDPIELTMKNIGLGHLNITHMFKDGKYWLGISRLPVGKTLLKFNGADIYGCTSNDSMYVTRFRDTVALKFDSVPQKFCEFDPSRKLISNPPAELWRSQKGVELIGGDYYFNPSKALIGLNKVYTEITDSILCRHIDYTFIYVRDSLNPTYILGDSLCARDSLYSLPLNSPFPGTWVDTSNTLTVTSGQVKIDRSTAPGRYIFRREFTTAELYQQCFDLPDFTLLIYEDKKPKLLSDTTICRWDSLVKLRNYPKFNSHWEGAGVEKKGNDYYINVTKQYASNTPISLLLQDNDGVCKSTLNDNFVLSDTILRPYSITQKLCSKVNEITFPSLKNKNGKPLDGSWTVFGSANTNTNTLYLNEQDSGMQKVFFELSALGKKNNPCYIGDTSYIEVVKSPQIPDKDYALSRECLHNASIFYLDDKNYILKGDMIDSSAGQYYYNHAVHLDQILNYTIVKKGNKCPVQKPKMIRFILISQIIPENDTAVCRQLLEKVEIPFANTNGKWTGELIPNEKVEKVIFSREHQEGTYHYRFLMNNQGCKDSTTKTIIIRNQPVAAFISPTEKGEIPYTIDFKKQWNVEGRTFFWDFGTGDTLTSKEDQTYTYIDTGSFTVTMIAKSGLENCSDTATATILSYNPVGMADDQLSFIAIYPNPTDEILTIELPNADFQTATIYNGLGQKVMTKSINNDKKVNLSVASLKKGSYILELSNANQSLRKTFIKL